MDFDPSLSFDDNIALFKAEVERLDSECSHILFDNLELLLRDGDDARARQAMQEFYHSVIEDLDSLSERQTS